MIEGAVTRALTMRSIVAVLVGIGLNGILGTILVVFAVPIVPVVSAAFLADTRFSAVIACALVFAVIACAFVFTVIARALVFAVVARAFVFAVVARALVSAAVIVVRIGHTAVDMHHGVGADGFIFFSSRNNVEAIFRIGDCFALKLAGRKLFGWRGKGFGDGLVGNIIFIHVSIRADDEVGAIGGKVGCRDGIEERFEDA